MSTLRDNPHNDVGSIGLLAEPTRHLLYQYVSDVGRAISREEAAEGTHVPVHTAKFHLDKLVEGGLLTTEFHKLTGRTGPGSGRPSKHYRRGDTEIAVALPPRHYDLLSSLLSDAVAIASDTGEPVGQVVGRVARETGCSVGREHASVEDPESVLQSCGYEPATTGQEVILRNCPFQQTAARNTELICGINLDFVTGLLEGSGATHCEARLAPAPGQCCVAVTLT